MNVKEHNMSVNLNKDENTVYEVDLECVKMNRRIDQSKKIYGMSRKHNNIDLFWFLLIILLIK